jgi:type I restriction enzyme S subunit
MSILSSGIKQFYGTKEYLSTKSIKENVIESVEEEITFKKRPSRANMQPIVNSVWFAKMKATNKSYIFDSNKFINQYILSTGFCGLTSSTVDINFIKYYTRSYLFSEEKDINSYGTTQESINESRISNLCFVQPPFQEQQTIANYLDKATSKIDAFIQKQTKLIELLKEKRQAVISSAVTRGLDSTVAMKDSEVEWLGEIPKGWEGCLLKYNTNKITDGAHISPDLNNGSYYFVSVKDITSGNITLDQALLTSHESYQYLVKTGCKPEQGDILLGKDGTIGISAIVDIDTPFVVASSLIIIRPLISQYSKFINYCCQASFFQEQIKFFVQGAGLKRLSIQNLLKIYAVFPPLQEQQNIATYLDGKTSEIDSLITKSTKAIELLKEKRTALISAAVTGKIDVREVA